MRTAFFFFGGGGGRGGRGCGGCTINDLQAGFVLAMISSNSCINMADSL